MKENNTSHLQSVLSINVRKIFSKATIVLLIQYNLNILRTEERGYVLPTIEAKIFEIICGNEPTRESKTINSQHAPIKLVKILPSLL